MNPLDLKPLQLPAPSSLSISPKSNNGSLSSRNGLSVSFDGSSMSRQAAGQALAAAAAAASGRSVSSSSSSPPASPSSRYSAVSVASPQSSRSLSARGAPRSPSSPHHSISAAPYPDSPSEAAARVAGLLLSSVSPSQSASSSSPQQLVSSIPGAVSNASPSSPTSPGSARRRNSLQLELRVPVISLDFAHNNSSNSSSNNTPTKKGSINVIHELLLAAPMDGNGASSSASASKNNGKESQNSSNRTQSARLSYMRPRQAQPSQQQHSHLQKQQPHPQAQPQPPQQQQQQQEKGKGKVAQFFQDRYEKLLKTLELKNEKKKKEEDDKREREKRVQEHLKKQLGLEHVGSTKTLWFGSDQDPSSSSPSVTPAPIPSSSLPSASNSSHQRRKSSMGLENSKKLSSGHSSSSDDEGVKRHHNASNNNAKPRRSASHTRSSSVGAVAASRSPSKLSNSVKDNKDKDNKEGKDASRISSDGLNKMVSRLYQVKKPDLNKVCENTADWKRKHGMTDDTKVFLISGPYEEVRKNLLARGWVENEDVASPYFDFKFALYGKDCNYSQLEPHQIINHLEGNGAVSTKVGLCESLRNLQWFESVDIDTFFPRCFDLSQTEELAEYIEEFRLTAAQALLKRVDDSQEFSALQPHDQFLVDMITLAMSICKHRLAELDSLRQDIDDQSGSTFVKPSDAEWKVFLDFIANGTRPAAPAAAAIGPSLPALRKETNALLKLIKEKHPQYVLDGHKNVWIIKPGRKSRGRGIACFNDLYKIEDYMRKERDDWMIQKYLEGPLLVKGVKFDIRQWVLVKSLNPLTIFFYDDCYCRFCTTEYSLDDLDNKFVHLANNSIQKNSDDFETTEYAESGNMWHSDEFKEYLKATTGSTDIWYNHIQPQMQRIVRWAFESALDSIEHRRGSFEVFGIDFMIDESFGVWLIEINTSPDLSFSTPVTEVLVKEMIDDMCKVVVDVPAQMAENRKSSAAAQQQQQQQQEGDEEGGSASTPITPKSPKTPKSMRSSRNSLPSTPAAAAAASSSAAAAAPSEPFEYVEQDPTAPGGGENDYDGYDTGKYRCIFKAKNKVSCPALSVGLQLGLKGEKAKIHKSLMPLPP